MSDAGRVRHRGTARDEESAELAARVVACVPPGQPAFLKLLGLLEIVASREVSTACVTLGARSRLLLNPDFVKANCRTEAELRSLVMHELFHVLLGHTRLCRKMTPARNWAFDVLINAQLCQLFPDPADTALFRRLYRADRMPEALLRPPPGWRTAAERWPLEGLAGDLHRAVYSERQVTEAELVTLLEMHLDGGNPGTGKLLGNHGTMVRDGTADGPEPGEASGGSPDGALDPVLSRTLRELFDSLTEGGGVDARHGNRRCTTRRVGPRMPAGPVVAVVRRALLALTGSDEPWSGDPRSGEAPVEGFVPWRGPRDRRALVLEELGELPLLQRAPLPGRTVLPVESVHLYLDVSGSMRGELAPLCGLLPAFERWLHPRIHLFSTVVRDVSLRSLSRGLVETTGGTRIDGVTEHMRREGVRRALIVTDGMVGEIPESHRRALRYRRIGVLLTARGSSKFAAGTGWRVTRLPELDGGTVSERSSRSRRKFHRIPRAGGRVSLAAARPATAVLWARGPGTSRDVPESGIVVPTSTVRGPPLTKAPPLR